MRPEMPFLAAGGIAIAGGVARDKGFPRNGVVAIVGTVALVILASATSETAIAPLVRALGFLLVLAAAMSAIPHFTRKAQ